MASKNPKKTEKKVTRPRGAGAMFYSESKQLWVARIELPPRNGLRRQKEITAKTRERLQQKMRDPLKQFAMAGDLPTGGTRLDKYLRGWLVEASERLRPNTLAGYRAVLENHIIPEIGHVRLDKLTPTHLRRAYTRITSTPKNPAHPERGNLTSTYALNAHRVLSAALKSAEREGVIGRNPAALMDAPRKSRQTLEALTVGEAITVMARAVPELEKAAQPIHDPYDPEPVKWATYLLTGMRRGELLGLEWDRITDVIDLSWQLQRIRDLDNLPADYEYRHITGTMFWVRPKSLAGTRIIPLVEPLRTMLEHHRELSPANKWGLVFTNDGLPIDPDTESKRWPVALSESGIDKKVRLHGLRHTTVDLLLEAGVHEDIVMEIVGHSSRAVTRGYKSPHALKRREEAMKQLSVLLGHKPDA